MHDLTSVLARLYASEINCSISSFWDGGFDVKLGDEMNGWKAETTIMTEGFGVETVQAALETVATWLTAQAIYHFPQSDFAHSLRAL